MMLIRTLFLLLSFSMRLNNMKILIEIVAALLCLDLLPTVITYYVSNEDRNIGLVVVSKGHGSYKNGVTGVQRIPFTRQNKPSYFKSTNEHIVNSHFRVMKTSNFHIAKSLYEPKLNQEVEVLRKTGPPNQPRLVREESPIIPDSNQNNNPRNHEPNENHNDFRNNHKVPILPRGGNRESHKSQINANGYTINQAGSNPKSMEVNVHKTQIPAVPQKIKLNSNRHLVGLRVPNYYESDMLRPSVRNSQLMAQMLDSMSTKHFNEIPSKQSMAYKRDTLPKNTIEGHNLRKENKPALDIKDKFLDQYSNSHSIDAQIKRLRIDEPGRIGSRGAGLEINPTPYAVFYRMNPEIMDREVGFIPFEDVGTSDEYNNTNKNTTRLTNNYADNQVRKSRKRSTNSIQVLKRIKNLNLPYYKKV